MTPRTCLIAIGLSTLCTQSFATAGDSPHAWRRWAVVCSPEVRSSGLGDLVTVELGKVKDIELVERDELAKIESELKLSQLVGAEDAADRLRLGQRLKADCLVLLGRGDVHLPGPLQIVIADCLQGARLHQQELAQDSPVKLAQQVREAVLATRRRFPHGVTRILGVSDFLDRNLTHDFNSLQAGYARLLGAELSLPEGAALLEIDEARAIARELAGQDLGPRCLPLLVEAEYRMEGPPGPESTKVTLVVHCHGGREDRTITSPELSLTSAPKWIATELAQRITANAAAQSPLDVDSQIKLLSARADDFLRLAAVDQVVPLREAILLLNPALTEQRLLLLDERIELIRRRANLEVVDSFPGSPSIHEVYGRSVDIYLQALDDFENLIVLRQIDRQRALVVLQALRDSLATPCIVRDIGEQHYYRIGQEELARAQKPTRRFYLEVVPKIRYLPYLPGRAAPQNAHFQAWQRAFLSGVASRTDVPYLIAKDLKDLLRAYAEILPDGLSIDTLSLPGPGMEDGPRAATEEDFEEFYRAMAESHHKMSALRGRYVLLFRAFGHAQMTPEVAARKGKEAFYMALSQQFRKKPIPREQALAFLEQVRKLQDDYLKSPRIQGMPPAEIDGGWQELARLRREMELALEPAKPLRRERELPEEKTTGAVRFTPVTVQARRLDGSVEWNRNSATFLGYSGLSIVPCGPDFDAYWNPRSIYVMRKEGVLEEIFRDPSCAIRSAAWDGRQLWFVSGDEALILGSDGKVRAKADRDLGLPPGLSVLQPTAPGRAVALGSFDASPRAWAATISTADAAAPTVRVFYEAKNVDTPRDRVAASEALDIGFTVKETHLYQPKSATADPLLLVMRNGRSPLEIDLKTMAVSLFSYPYHGERGGRIVYSRDGALWMTDLSMLRVMASPGERWPDGRVAREVEVVNPPAPNSRYADLASAERLKYLLAEPRRGGQCVLDPGDGYLYYLGQYWYRIKLSTMTAQRLTSTWMPPYYDMCGAFAVTRHYGMVCWNQGKLLRIAVDEASIPPSGGPIAK